MEMEKRLKRSSVDEIDRISEFPESVLLHILSFLDMKDVVRTSVLSKNWECIWTSIPTLTFKYNKYEEREEKIRPFVMWVNKTLFQCESTAIKKIHVEFWYMKEFAGDIDLWAKFVARNKIQDMSLEFTSNDSYKLPRSLCQNSSLLSLSISFCTVSLGVEICWTSLKTLTIGWMSLDDNIMTKILSATPMLQVLKISYCRSINVLHIYSNSLKELVIDSFGGESLLEISAPNIQSLRILGHDFTGKLVLCSSSLYTAELDFGFNYYYDSKKKQCRSNFMTILESILPVVQLEVGFHFLKTFALLGNNNSLSSPFSRLTCLKLNGVMDKTDIVGIICLLKCSPNLEKLVVNRKYSFYRKQIKSIKKVADEYWESERRMEKFELPYLKMVKFNGFQEVDEFTHVLLKLLRENAVPINNIVFDLGDLPMILIPKPCVA